MRCRPIGALAACTALAAGTAGAGGSGGVALPAVVATEAAGAAPLAALMQERGHMAGKRIALVLSGGNIDRPLYLRLLGGHDPS